MSWTIAGLMAYCWVGGYVNMAGITAPAICKIKRRWARIVVPFIVGAIWPISLGFGALSLFRQAIQQEQRKGLL